MKPTKRTLATALLGAGVLASAVAILATGGNLYGELSVRAGNDAFRIGHVAAVQEPMPVWLLGAGLLLMALVRRRRGSRR